MTLFLGNDLGTRLQKGREPLPEAETENLTKTAALANAQVWDDYLERQAPTKAKRRGK